MNTKAASSIIQRTGTISIATTNTKLQKLAESGGSLTLEEVGLAGLQRKTWDSSIFNIVKTHSYLDDTVIDLLFAYTAIKNPQYIDRFLYISPISFSAYHISVLLGKEGVNAVGNFLKKYLAPVFSDKIDTVFLPFVLNSHWFLVVANLEDGEWKYSNYDSLKGHIPFEEKQKVIDSLSFALKGASRLNSGESWGNLWREYCTASFKIVDKPTSFKTVECSQQEDSYECGWYVWLFAQTIIRKKFKKFSTRYFMEGRQAFITWASNLMYRKAPEP